MSNNHRIKKEIPRVVPIFWQCMSCGELFPWPQVDAKKYCSDTCRYRAGYLNKKNKKGPAAPKE